MAKNKNKQTQKEKPVPSVQAKESELKLPLINNIHSLIEFIESLEEENRNIYLKDLATILTGTTLVNQVNNRTKGVKQNEILTISSIKFYNSKIVGGSQASNRIRAIMATYLCLPYFTNSEQLLQFIDQLIIDKGANGKVIPKIHLYPDKLYEHLGGVSRQIGGLLTSHPVYNPKSFGINMKNLTIEQLLETIPYKTYKPTSEDIVEEIYRSTNIKIIKENSEIREQLIFTDGIKLDTSNNLTPMENSINSLLMKVIGFNQEYITRPFPSMELVTPLDPNEPGISAIEKKIRLAKITKN